MTVSATTAFPTFTAEKTPSPSGPTQENTAARRSQEFLQDTREFSSQFQTPQAPMVFSAFPLDNSPTGTGGDLAQKRLVSPPQPTEYPAKPTVTTQQ